MSETDQTRVLWEVRAGTSVEPKTVSPGESKMSPGHWSSWRAVQSLSPKERVGPSTSKRGSKTGGPTVALTDWHLWTGGPYELDLVVHSSALTVLARLHTERCEQEAKTDDFLVRWHGHGA